MKKISSLVFLLVAAMLLSSASVFSLEQGGYRILENNSSYSIKNLHIAGKSYDEIQPGYKEQYSDLIKRYINANWNQEVEYLVTGMVSLGDGLYRELNTIVRAVAPGPSATRGMHNLIVIFDIQDGNGTVDVILRFDDYVKTYHGF